MLPRRDFLKGIGALTATAACERQPAAPPPGVDHLVVVMMENRSFDHYYGSYSLDEGRLDIDGLLPGMANPDGSGQLVVPARSEAFCLPDPPHGWSTSRDQFAGGTCDGFVTSYLERHGTNVDPAWVMGYHDRSQIPTLYGLADHYALCERWFSSIMGPTWPNRLYSLGAQNEGMFGNDLPDGWFYKMRTIFHLLDEAGVPWSYYYSDAAFAWLLDGFADRDEVRPIDEFFADARAGTLPAVSWIDPAVLFTDDHPPHHPKLGQLFLGSLHNALAASPHWERSMLVIDYDEHGGFYDHVPPPTAADDRAETGHNQLGFRIPAVVAGPWVRGSHVSDVVFDHTSVLAFIEHNWGLPALTARDAAATGLEVLLDPAAMETAEPLPPADLPVIPLSEEEIAAECGNRSRRGSQPELEAVLDELADPRWTQADHAATYRYLVEEAERLGVCTITS